MNNMRNEARALARAELPIIALKPKSKQPKDQNWNKDDSCLITTENQLRALNGNNIGLCLAKVKPQPWAALDVDDLEWTRDYFESIGISLDGLLNAEGSVIVNSGKANHTKLFFTIPTPMKTIRHGSEGKTRFELRCADSNGGSVQDVMPPSIHPETGQQYKWGGKGYLHGQVPKPVPMPEELLKLWNELIGGVPKPTTREVIEKHSDSDITLREAVKALRDVPADKLNRDEWAKIGMALKTIDSGEEGKKEFARWSSTDFDNYEPRELEYQWNSFKDDGEITGATILWFRNRFKTEEKIPENGFPLPSARTNHISYKQSADHIWSVAKAHGLAFHRSGLPVELIDGKIKPIDKHRLSSLVEKLARKSGQSLGTLKAHGNGIKWSSTQLNQTQSQVILADEGTIREGLDEIVTVSHTPILSSDGEILREGYHAKYKTLVTGGEVEDVPIDTAIESIKDLTADFLGSRPSDVSRLVSAFLTPAAKVAKIIDGHTPLFFYEADESQSGKGTYAEAVPKIYSERSISVKQYGAMERNSATKQIDVALVDGRNYITLDNWRGKLDLPVLESLITGEEGSHLADKKFSRDVEVDPTKVNWAVTSNGVQTTQDMFNRYCFIKLKRQPLDYQWKYGTKQGFHQHIADNQPFYLGCVFTVWKEWIARGRPITKDHSHALSGWAGSLDWIVCNLFELPPIGIDAKTRNYQVDPNLAFLRELCLVIKREDKLGEKLKPSDIASVLIESEICMPGSAQPFGIQYSAEGVQNIQAGRKMGSLLKKDGDSLEVGGFTITTVHEEKFEHDGFNKFYYFEEASDE